MLQISNRGFKRSYVYGGASIFSSMANIASRLIPAGKEAAKRAAMQLGKKAATEAGKKLGEKAVQKVSSLTSKSPSTLTSRSQDIIKKHTTPSPSAEEFNLNNLIMGSAVRIEDYIKRRNNI